MPGKDVLDLAYEHYNRYLDSDSADSGPIEDYIAAAITEGMMQTARQILKMAEDRCQSLNGDAVSQIRAGRSEMASITELKADQFEWMANAIRREFGLDQEGVARTRHADWCEKQRHLEPCNCGLDQEQGR